MPDAHLGVRIRAFVLLRAGATATAEDLPAHARESLLPYTVPSEIVFRTALPTSPIGKVLRRALRDGEG